MDTYKDYRLILHVEYTQRTPSQFIIAGKHYVLPRMTIDRVTRR